MTHPTDPSRPAAPTVREIAELTARLREISARGRDVDPAERARFLADKDALIARITATDAERGREAVRERYAAQDALTDAVRAGAEHPGYVLVGPSARTWLRDPVTGAPAAPVSEHEHRAVRELLNREELDTTEPAWVTGPDGHADIHSTVVPTHADADADADDAGWGSEPAGPRRWADPYEPVEDFPALVRDADGYEWRHVGEPGEFRYQERDCTGEDGIAAGGWADMPFPLDEIIDDDHRPRAADQDESVDNAADDDAPSPPMPEMPEWMREKALRTEAEIAAGTYVPGPVDDPARLAARLAELRAGRDSRDAPATPAASENADAVERAFDELCERHPLPGDGPGEWVTTRTGTFWEDYGEVDDDVSDEIATANPHIWDPPTPPTGGGHRDPLSCLDSSAGRVDEQERREQLTRWHVDDQAANAHTDDHAEVPDDALTRFTCGGSTCGGYDNQPGGTP